MTVIIFLGFTAIATAAGSFASNEPQILEQATIEIQLPACGEDYGSGGLIAHDLDGNVQLEFLISCPGRLMAAGQDGRVLWQREADIQITHQSEETGLPGHHAPGIQAGDVTGDGYPEVLYLTRSGQLHILNGASGDMIRNIDLVSPEGTERWEHLVVANFRGKGDRDLLLQATNEKGYRMGRFLAAYAVEDLIEKEAVTPLWTRDDFLAAAHSGARTSDLNGNGRDEVIGASIIDADGKKVYELPVRGHIDAVQIADVRPDLPGLEVVALEEGGRIKVIPFSDPVSNWLNWNINKLWGAGNRVFLFNTEGLIWQTNHLQHEPQNATVGKFAPDSKGLQTWARSRFNVDQQPFVFDAAGRLIAHYEMTEAAPKDWTRRGVEVIHAIHWTGSGLQQAAAKERHKAGDIAIFDPISGAFKVRVPTKADRLYVADVLGDWREELVVLSGATLSVYSNSETNPHPDRPSLWTMQHYRRSKQTWNYYNP